MRYLLYLCTVFLLVQCAKKKETFTTEVFKINKGYGYTILFDNKPLIKQNEIPAISQKRVFCNEKEAFVVANFVVKKLKENKTPTITLKDLNKLKIKFNCEN